MEAKIEMLETGSLKPYPKNSDSGDIVFDAYSGSGTTIMAAQRQGRKGRAIEIDPHYVDVAVKRWQDFTGRKAILEADGKTFDDVAASRGVQNNPKTGANNAICS